MSLAEPLHARHCFGFEAWQTTQTCNPQTAVASEPALMVATRVEQAEADLEVMEALGDVCSDGCC